MASEGGGGGAGSTTPDISGTTKGMTMKFLADLGVHKEARNQKNFLHNWSGL